MLQATFLSTLCSTTPNPVSRTAHSAYSRALAAPAAAAARTIASTAGLSYRAKARAGPLRPLQHGPGPRHPGRVGEQLRDADRGLGHRRAPLAASSLAFAIATSVRSSSSSHTAGVSRMPGLYCSTRGSRVEKIAHTPFS